MTRSNWVALAAALSAVALVAVYMLFQQPTVARGEAMILPVDPVPLIALTGEGQKTFSIEVADDITERTAGLMYREDMADDHGMLFVFDQTQMVGFWMKNTPMRLDLIFIGQDGKIRAIKEGEPFSEATISPGEPVRFVLEFKAGTAERNGIRDGDFLQHPAINGAPGAGNAG